MESTHSAGRSRLPATRLERGGQPALGGAGLGPAGTCHGGGADRACKRKGSQEGHKWALLPWNALRCLSKRQLEQVPGLLPCTAQLAVCVGEPHLNQPPEMQPWCRPGPLRPPAAARPSPGRRGWRPRRSKTQGRWLHGGTGGHEGDGEAWGCGVSHQAALPTPGKSACTLLWAQSVHCGRPLQAARQLCLACSPVWPEAMTAEVGKEPRPPLLVSTPPTLV